MKKVLKEQEYFAVDAVENAIDSLETAASFLDRDDLLKLKWIAITMHHSLYSFCISALEHGNYDNVLFSGNSRDLDKNHFMKKGNDLKWRKSKKIHIKGGPGYIIKWEYTEEEPPKTKEDSPKKEKLIGFWTALARVQDQEFWMSGYVHSKAVSLTEDEWESIYWLTARVRNDLVHFVPKLLLVSIEDVKRACLDIIRIIEFLCFESNKVFSLRPRWKSRVRKAIKKYRRFLNS